MSISIHLHLRIKVFVVMADELFEGRSELDVVFRRECGITGVDEQSLVVFELYGADYIVLAGF